MRKRNANREHYLLHIMCAAKCWTHVFLIVVLSSVAWPPLFLGFLSFQNGVVVASGIKMTASGMFHLFMLSILDISSVCATVYWNPGDNILRHNNEFAEVRRGTSWDANVSPRHPADLELNFKESYHVAHYCVVHQDKVCPYREVGKQNPRFNLPLHLFKYKNYSA